MKKFNFICLSILYSICSFAQQQSIPVPKPHQLKWHEAEMGAVFHYDLHVFDGIRYGQGNNRINPIEDYNILIQPNSILINGYKQPKLPDANLPYSQPPTKPDSDFGKVMSIRIA